MNALQDLFFFEPNALEDQLQRCGLGYQRAAPFAHAVFDDFLPQEVAGRIADEFPDADCSSFRFYPFPFLKQSGLQDKNFAGVTPFLRHILNEFNGKVFLEFLQRLTGIEGLIADPHFSGGAVHQILPGESFQYTRISTGTRDENSIGESMCLFTLIATGEKTTAGTWSSGTRI